ncbi:Crp/Fnr family transcriptional regulator [Novosphingobium resinovorum]|uniref:Crp/Fnr family transcriptional regulator n=1 Tax=Novosphingobium resinovorum TaxID=158500 RepID=UPI002ED06A89|nr:Crp/Fnr family transcriptional regulator [Novosphingobium resinovorum]
MLHEALIRKWSRTWKLTATDQQAVPGLCEYTRRVPRRADIISQGACPERIHIILTGWAARYNILGNGKRRITAILLAGDVCDYHGSILGRMDHSIFARTDCEIACVEPQRIPEISVSHPSLARAIGRSALIDEAIMRRWLVKSGRCEALEAVSHLLAELHVRAGVIGLTDDHSMEFPLIQEEIGDATGLTAVHVNRVFKKLRELQIVSAHQRRIFSHNQEELKSLGGFDL